MRVVYALIKLALVAGFLMVDQLAMANSLDELKAFSKDKQFAEGQFEQEVVSNSGKVKEKGKGVFAFSRPGKFMWNIQKPYPQLILADGKNVVSYDKDLAQASIRPLGKAIDSSPAALLFGNKAIDTLFNITDQGTEDGKSWLLAKPKGNETLFESIRIAMQNGLPVEVRINDAMGQTTRLKLTDWKFDKRKPDAFFEFTPPPGVDVIQAK